METTQTIPNLLWRSDFQHVLDRQRAWFAGQRKYLVTVIPDSWNSFNWDLSIDVPAPRPLETFDFSDESQLDEHLSYRLAQFEGYWRVKQEWGLDDDYLPVFEPRIGWAESVAAMVDGANLRYYAQTSAIDPVIEDYETFDWNRIRFDPAVPGSRLLHQANTWAATRGRRRFLVHPRGETISACDLAKACRGNNLFLDLVQDPDNVHQLMERCLQAVIALIEYEREVVGGTTLGGFVNSWHGGYWTPGTVLGHLGENVADLISGAMYDQFILPYTRRFVGHFGGGVYARDVTTHQIWPLLRKLGNVLAFKPRNMGNVRVNAERLRVIAEKTEGIPLFVEAFTPTEFAEFRQAVSETGIHAFFVVHCRTREEAARLLEQVRQMG
jgi:hypothetical protein